MKDSFQNKNLKDKYIEKSNELKNRLKNVKTLEEAIVITNEIKILDKMKEEFLNSLNSIGTNNDKNITSKKYLEVKSGIKIPNGEYAVNWNGVSLNVEVLDKKINGENISTIHFKNYNTYYSFDKKTGNYISVFQTEDDDTKWILYDRAKFTIKTKKDNTFIGTSSIIDETGKEINVSITFEIKILNEDDNNGNITLGSTATENTASGRGALNNNTTGSYNTASGSGALQNNKDGNENTASGFGALNKNTTGSYNTASGSGALNNNISGKNNTASGRLALYKNTVGSDNTAIGNNTLQENIDGIVNTSIGSFALQKNISG